MQTLKVNIITVLLKLSFLIKNTHNFHVPVLDLRITNVLTVQHGCIFT